MTPVIIAFHRIKGTMRVKLVARTGIRDGDGVGQHKYKRRRL